MKSFLTLICAVFLSIAALSAGEPPKKNWTPPPYKIYAQQLSDPFLRYVDPVI